MKRRQFLNTTAISATAAATAAACAQSISTDAQSDASGSLPRVEWRMTTSWPKSLDTIFGGAQTTCDRVSEITGGRFTITPFAAGEIVGGLEVLDAVQSGTVECGHTASYYYIGKNKALGFGSSMPFGFTAQQQNAWLYHGGGMDLMNKLYSDFNIVWFPAGNTGAQMGGWFKQNIQAVGDLNGLKMRIPGLGGEVMAKLGVNVQVLPGGEIFLALDRGAIDAAEFVGPYDDEKLGLQNAADFYFYPGWWEPGTTLDIPVNRAAWDKLPPEYQTALRTATYESNLNMLSKYEALNGEALQRLVSGGTQLTPFSPEILQAAEKAAIELYEADASADATFKEVYDNWKTFRDRIRAWNQINELSFTQFVSRQANGGTN